MDTYSVEFKLRSKSLEADDGSAVQEISSFL